MFVAFRLQPGEWLFRHPGLCGRSLPAALSVRYYCHIYLKEMPAQVSPGGRLRNVLERAIGFPARPKTLKERWLRIASCNLIGHPDRRRYRIGECVPCPNKAVEGVFAFAHLLRRCLEYLHNFLFWHARRPAVNRTLARCLRVSPLTGRGKSSGCPVFFVELPV